MIVYVLGSQKMFSLQKVSHTEPIYWASHVIINSGFLVGGDVNGDTVAYTSSTLDQSDLRFMNKTNAYDVTSRQSFRILPNPSKVNDTGSGCIKWHDEIVIKLNNDEECIKPYFPEYPMYGCKLASLDPSGVLFFRNSFSVFSITPPSTLRKEGCLHAGEQFKLFLVSSQPLHDKVSGLIDDKVISTYDSYVGSCQQNAGQVVNGKDYVTIHEGSWASCRQRSSTFDSCLAYEHDFTGRCEIWLSKPTKDNSTEHLDDTEQQNNNRDHYCNIKQNTVQYDLVNDARGFCRMSSDNEGVEGTDFASVGFTSLSGCRNECSANFECMAFEYSDSVCKIYFNMPKSVSESGTIDSRCEFKRLLSKSSRRRSQDATSVKSSHDFISRREFYGSG
eukprot:Awhi_evm1s10641